MFKRIFNLAIALGLLIGIVHLGDQTLHNIDVVQDEITTLAKAR